MRCATQWLRASPLERQLHRDWPTFTPPQWPGFAPPLTGEADEPSDRTRRQTFSELNQLAFTFGKEEGAGLAYRFAVETDFDGSITSIKFVGLRGDSPVFVWDVPYAEAVSLPPAAPATEGVDLPKPEVRVPGADESAKSKPA